MKLHIKQINRYVSRGPPLNQTNFTKKIPFLATNGPLLSSVMCFKLIKKPTRVVGSQLGFIDKTYLCKKYVLHGFRSIKKGKRKKWEACRRGSMSFSVASHPVGPTIQVLFHLGSTSLYPWDPLPGIQRRTVPPQSPLQRDSSSRLPKAFTPPHRGRLSPAELQTCWHTKDL